jgi:hypothetical protein
MPLFDEFADARAVSPAAIGAIQLSKTLGTYVGTTALQLVRPTGVRLLTVRCESGTIRMRPGRYAGWRFTGGNMVMGTDTIDVEAQESPNTHGYVTGDGPFQITIKEAEMVAGTPIVIDAAADTFTRTGGTWWQDGFWPGATFTVAESSDNNGVFTVDTVTNTVLTVDEDITVGEGSQTDLTLNGIGAALHDSLSLLTNYWAIVVDANTIKAATSLVNALAGIPVDLLTAGFNGGRMNWGGSAGWAAAAVAPASKADGYGSLAVTAGNEISLAAPERFTMVGMSASDACSYWFSK